MFRYLTPDGGSGARSSGRLCAAFAVALCGIWPLCAASAALEPALAAEGEVRQVSTAAQSRVEALDDETRELLETYRRVSEELASLRAFNDDLERRVRGQEQELARTERELASVDATRTGLVPMLERMQAVLARLVQEDLPFLPGERRARVARIAGLAADPETALVERYRALLEAYQVEASYGYGIEAYRGRLDDGRMVDFLRLGRVALYYRSLDGNRGGMFDPDAGGWIALDAAAVKAVDHGLRVARKALPPDLLSLPVPAPGATP